MLTDVLPGPNALSATGTLSPALAQLALQRERGPRVIDSDVDAFERVDRFGVTNRTEIQLADDTELVSIFGYRHTKIDYYSSVDGLPSLISDGTGAIPAGLPVTVVGGRQTSDVEQFPQEIQLRGKLLDQKMDWIVGAFYLASDPSGRSGSYIPTFILPGITDAPFNYNFFSERSKALFASIGLDLGSAVEGLRFNAGLRYTRDGITACIGNGTSSLGAWVLIDAPRYNSADTHFGVDIV